MSILINQRQNNFEINSYEEFISERCKRDVKGNPYIKVMLPIRIGCSLLLLTTLLSYVFKLNEIFVNLKNNFINSILIMSLQIILCIVAINVLRRKDTITKYNLICRRMFSKTVVSLDELKIQTIFYPPKISNNGKLLLKINNKTIRISYINCYGGYDFVKILNNRLKATTRLSGR